MTVALLGSWCILGYGSWFSFVFTHTHTRNYYMKSTLSSTLHPVLEQYCSIGLKVIPLWGTEAGNCNCGKQGCTSQGKHPRIAKNWQLLGSSDVKKVASWQKKYKGCNFGVMTGTSKYPYGSEESLTDKQRWLVVVDVDDLAALSLFDEPLLPTFSCETGRGRHYWYWSKKLFPASKNVLAEKVDIKAKGGYVVAPPSVHYTGRHYTVTPGMEQHPIVDLPEWIEQRLETAMKQASTGSQRKTRKGSTVTIRRESIEDAVETASKAALQHADPLVQKVSFMNVHVLREWLDTGGLIPLGARNTCIHKLLSSDRARGADQATLEKNASVYADFCVFPETITDLELKNIVTSVLKYDASVTTHKKYNEVYVKWLTKTKAVNVSGAETTHRTLETIDQLLFYAMRINQDSKYVATADTIHNTLTLANWRLMRDAAYASLGLTMQSRIKDLDEHNLFKDHGLNVHWFGGGYVNRKRVGKKEKYVKASLFSVLADVKNLLDAWLVNGLLPEEVKSLVDEKSLAFLQDTRYWKKYAPPAGEVTVKAGKAPKTFHATADRVELGLSPVSSVVKVRKAAGVTPITTTASRNYVSMSTKGKPPNLLDTMHLSMVGFVQHHLTVEEVHMEHQPTLKPEKVKTTIKRNVNPNMWKYASDDSMEEMSSNIAYYNKLIEKYGALPDVASDEQLLNAALAEDWVCDVRVGDVVGVGNKVYKVTNIPDSGPFQATLYPRKENKHRVNAPPAGAPSVDITLRSVDSGLAQGRCEILYRDGRPYGFEDYEATVLLPPKVPNP